MIDRGIKVAEGTPAELKTSVGESSLQLRLSDTDLLDEAGRIVHRVAGVSPVMTPEAGALNVPLPDANKAADVLIALRESGISITSAAVQQPSLDEVFLALTGHDASSTANTESDLEEALR